VLALIAVAMSLAVALAPTLIVADEPPAVIVKVPALPLGTYAKPCWAEEASLSTAIVWPPMPAPSSRDGDLEVSEDSRFAPSPVAESVRGRGRAGERVELAGDGVERGLMRVTVVCDC
jgi:hypothetical protein